MLRLPAADSLGTNPGCSTSQAWWLLLSDRAWEVKAGKIRSSRPMWAAGGPVSKAKQTEN